MKELKIPFYAKLALFLIIFIGAGYICVLGQELVVPLLFSFLFAVLLLPVTNFFEHRLRLPRSVAAVTSVVLFLASILLVLYVMGAQVVSMSSRWPYLKSQLESLTHSMQIWLADTFHINVQHQSVYFKNAVDHLMTSSGSIVEQTVLSFSGILLFLVFIFIYTILILNYRRLLLKFVKASFAAEYTGLITDILGNIKYIIRKYITGLFFEMVIIAIIAGLVFWALGIDYVFLLALIVGVFNVIPYVGIFTALVISVFITFATTNGEHALFVGISIICIHLVDSNFLMPKIVGSQVKLNPLIVIIGVIAGEMMFGISGMFLSIPYLAIAKVIFDRVQGMEPWGILFGEEEYPKAKKVKMVPKDEATNGK